MRQRLLFADFNNHLLPAMHDGPTYLAESVSMLHRLQEAGVTRVLLTPTYHPSFESIRRFLHRRADTWKLLRPEIPHGMQVLLGAQTALEPRCTESAAISDLALPGSHYLLVELPLHEFADWIDYELHLILHRRKLFPIFAHFERSLITYPKEISDRLMTVPGAAYQFSLRALRFPDVLHAVRLLAEQNKPVLFGTGAHSDNGLFDNISAILDETREQLGVPLYTSMLLRSYTFASFSPSLR